jgi:hypothetical protein
VTDKSAKLCYWLKLHNIMLQAARRKIPVMARLGGYVHIATLFLERLRIEPVTLGGHRRSFAEGTITAAFKVTESTVTSKGRHYRELRADRAIPTVSV